ncbi:MAG: GGDEF domain-containing protein [Terriglobales bacterium]
MDEWDNLESRASIILDAYIHILRTIEEVAGYMSRGEGRQLREDMRAILSYLNPGVHREALDKSRTQADEALRSLADVINQREYEYKEIIRIMAEAGNTMAQTGAAHSEKLRRQAAKVEAIATLDSVADVRHQLTIHVAELQEMAVRAQEEGEAQSKRLNEELQQAREKLNYASALAETDPLTSLGNRRRAENTAQQALLEGLPVSVLMLDLNSFKTINDTYGHAQGDSLLRSVAHHVRRAVRQVDAVCRWGGDEFVVIMHDTRLDVALLAAIRIRAEAFGDFVLTRAGENVKVVISTSIGAAESQPADTADSLIERADREMYEDKKRSKAAVAAAAR